MLQGEILVFCFTFVLLRSYLFASIGKKVWFTFMKCNKLIICGFTKIYLYRFYIPEFIIRLANDVQTTQVQELLIWQVVFAGCRLKFNYNWKTAGT